MLWVVAYEGDSEETELSFSHLSWVYFHVLPLGVFDQLGFFNVLLNLSRQAFLHFAPIKCFLLPVP